MKFLYQTFRAFLRDNDCERQFDRAFYTQCGANVLDETLADILVIDETFLNRCFDWSRTEEGRQFWKELDDKWWKKYGSGESREDEADCAGEGDYRSFHPCYVEEVHKGG